jgi:tRNA(Ile2) C34 agmatinyltransferase TiaS
MADIFKKLKRFYEKHFKSHCPDCGGVLDSIGVDMKWGRMVYECRRCKRWWI